MPNSELMHRADELMSATDALMVKVELLTVRVAKNRSRMALMVWAVVVCLLVSIGTIVALVEINHTARDVRASTYDAAQQLCASRNENATRQRALWDGVLTLTQNNSNPNIVKTPGDIERQARLRAGLNALLDKTFIQRDCTKPLTTINR